MKKTVTYLFIVFLATLVFYGGAGVSLVTYCCGDCQTEGVTALLENKCCEMHGQARCASQDGCCCDVEYVSFDWNVFHGHLFNLQPVAIDLISHICSHLSLVPVPFINEAEKSSGISSRIRCRNLPFFFDSPFDLVLAGVSLYVGSPLPVFATGLHC